MPLRYFNKKRNLANILFVSILLPYLLLCLTMGGFHDTILNNLHCNHTQQITSNNTDSLCIVASEDVPQHNSETCQICQWLKTPSLSMEFLLPDTQFECIHTGVICYFNPILSSSSIHRFTIRPPPSLPC